MNKIWIGLATVGMLAALGCGKRDIDTTPPGMTLLRLVPAPAPGEICGFVEDSVFVLHNGQDFEMDVLFQDDVALSQYKIDIHHNFDCHGHGGSAPGISIPDVANQTEDWAVLDIVDLNGDKQTVTRTLKVPDNVTAGAYHFQIQVIDQAGNDNPLANFYSLRIKNLRDTVPPTIAASLPTGNNFTAAKGSRVRFVGRVTDNHSLSEGGNGLLYLSYTDLQSGNTFNTNQVFPFSNAVGTSYDFDFEFLIPATLRTGNFRFSLRAIDGVRNVAEPLHFMVNVTN